MAASDKSAPTLRALRLSWIASLTVTVTGLTVAAISSGTIRTLGGIVLLAGIVVQGITWSWAWRLTAPHSARDFVSYGWMFGRGRH